MKPTFELASSNEAADTSCGIEEEGQTDSDSLLKKKESV